MNVALEMVWVWEETAQNVTKSFGDGWVREASKVRQRRAEISPRHPKASIAELGHRGLKPKASGQRHQGRVG